MNLTVVAVGKKMPDWINRGVNEYRKRFAAGYTFTLIEVNAVKRGQSKSIGQIKSAEASHIKAALSNNSITIALDEQGKQVTTRELADKIARYHDASLDISFVVGGADGLDEALISEAREVLALSHMTLPHSIARLVLCEQLYRAISILTNHPYHRE